MAAENDIGSNMCSLDANLGIAGFHRLCIHADKLDLDLLRIFVLPDDARTRDMALSAPATLLSMLVLPRPFRHHRWRQKRFPLSRVSFAAPWAHDLPSMLLCHGALDK